MLNDPFDDSTDYWHYALLLCDFGNFQEKKNEKIETFWKKSALTTKNSKFSKENQEDRAHFVGQVNSVNERFVLWFCQVLRFEGLRMKLTMFVDEDHCSVGLRIRR